MPGQNFYNFYEEIGNTPLVPDDMTEPNVEDLTIPTRAELEERQAKEQENGNDAAATSDADTADQSQDDKENTDTGAGADGNAGGADAQAATQQDAEVYEASLEDPGEFVPGDHSFDVTVYDPDGKNPRTVKIESAEQWDQLLEADTNLGTAAALMKAGRMVAKMELDQERDRRAYDEKKAAFDAQQKDVQVRNEQIQRMASELSYLVSRGDLPAIPKQYQNADWSDPEVAKQPGVKEQLALLDYMKKENAARTKAGLAPFSSMIDVFNQYDREQAKAKAAQANKDAGVQRREAGAKVAATTPNPVQPVRKDVAVGRSLGDLSALSDL